MNKLLVKFAIWLLNKQGYYVAAVKEDESKTGDDILLYYTDSHSFCKMLKYSRDSRY